MKESNVKGFTLIEILIVIAIIAILAGLSIPVYMKYQQKSKVSSYALPIVKACAYDASGYCAEKTLAEQNSVIDVSSLKNCQTAFVPYGSLTITISGSLTCSSTGHITDGIVTGTLNGINEYQAKCSFEKNGILCTVVPM